MVCFLVISRERTYIWNETQRWRNGKLIIIINYSHLITHVIDHHLNHYHYGLCVVVPVCVGVCVCEWVSHNGVQCTGACVNILPEWFDRGVWKIEYTLSIVGPIVSVLIFHSLFFFLPHSIKWRWWNRNRIWVIENSKSWEWTRKLKILDTAPNFVIPFFLDHSCFF